MSRNYLTSLSNHHATNNTGMGMADRPDSKDRVPGTTGRPESPWLLFPATTSLTPHSKIPKPNSGNMSHYHQPVSPTNPPRHDSLLPISNGMVPNKSHQSATNRTENNGVYSSEYSEVPNFSYGNAGHRAGSIAASESSLYIGPTDPAENLPDLTVSIPNFKRKVAEAKSDQNEMRTMSPSALSDRTRRSRATSEADSYETQATSLPALQTKGQLDETDALEPLAEEEYEPGSFDLVAPVQDGCKQYSLETRSEQLFSTAHLKVIFADPSLLLAFTSFLGKNRPSSIPVLIYYLDAVKALKAIKYANAIAEALDPIPGFNFTQQTAAPTANEALEAKAQLAFEVLARDDLAAYITHIWTRTVSTSISKRISGTLPLHLREASEGLAEVFCLTDPSRPDNPIVFASEEFHRTTQYGMSYVIGRNCRFLQGPKTNPFSVRRIRDKIDAGQEHCEVFLNYRRDGSPFMNLLMVAPLCDSRGKIRYFIGAQVDISGLVKECSDLESLERVVVEAEVDKDVEESAKPKKDEFQDLSEMLNIQELDTVRRWGGRMHKDQQEEIADSNGNSTNWNKPRVLIHDASPDGNTAATQLGSPRTSGRLSGVYEHYLLVRPYPSLRVLFASPSLRVPGILQSPFMDKIGGSARVRDELTQAMADGRGVTAKVRWITKNDIEGRNRWIHCTPLLGNNGAIGVWMVVIVDDEKETGTRRFRQAPPVEPKVVMKRSADAYGSKGLVAALGGVANGGHRGDSMSLRDFALANGAESARRPSTSHQSETRSNGSGTASPAWTLKIDS